MIAKEKHIHCAWSRFSWEKYQVGVGRVITWETLDIDLKKQSNQNVNIQFSLNSKGNNRLAQKRNGYGTAILTLGIINSSKICRGWAQLHQKRFHGRNENLIVECDNINVILARFLFPKRNSPQEKFLTKCNYHMKSGSH